MEILFQSPVITPALNNNNSFNGNSFHRGHQFVNLPVQTQPQVPQFVPNTVNFGTIQNTVDLCSICGNLCQNFKSLLEVDIRTGQYFFACSALCVARWSQIK